MYYTFDGFECMYRHSPTWFAGDLGPTANFLQVPRQQYGMDVPAAPMQPVPRQSDAEMLSAIRSDPLPDQILMDDCMQRAQDGGFARREGLLLFKMEWVQLPGR